MFDADDHRLWIAIVSFAGFAFQFGLLVLFCGVRIFLCQGVLWFWEGHRSQMPIGVHIPHSPDNDWRHSLINEIAEWLFDLPISLVGITVGVAVIAAAVWLDSLAWEQIRDNRRAKQQRR